MSRKWICAYNGTKGAYAEMAIINHFGEKAETLAVKSFDEIFTAVVDKRADFGMVPIENCTAGSVYQNYDNITKNKAVSIIGAETLRIEHSLMAIKGTDLASIKTVTSHPQALSQCSEIIKANKWLQKDANSTAEACEAVSKMQDPKVAAIANSRNAELYNLQILKQGIENNSKNYTRFLIIASNEVIENGLLPDEIKNERPNMLSVVFDTKNEQGALYNVLGIFNKYNINLNRLESRPIIGKPWRYWFYIDGKIGTDVENPFSHVNNLLEELNSHADSIRLLGVYKEL